MKKIIILGCENTHASAFINILQTVEEFSDIQVVGVYSEDATAAEKLREKYGVPVMAHYADAVGKIDGLMVTARHGDNHYKYAKPYMDSGIPMFIDKPITISEAEAVEFIGRLKEKNIPVTGGSTLRHEAVVCQLAEHCANQTDGMTVGGMVRAPLKSASANGGFFFYAQHLVEMVSKIFGRYPRSVRVFWDENKNRTVLFSYGAYQVTGLYTEDSNEYYAARFALNGTQGGVITSDHMRDWYYAEFKEFARTLNGAPQAISYADFVAPVFINNAIDKASRTGEEELVRYTDKL